MPDSISLSSSCSCMGRTCLAWSADGELNALDLQLVLERLAQVDRQVTVLDRPTLHQETCSSIS